MQTEAAGDYGQQLSERGSPPGAVTTDYEGIGDEASGETPCSLNTSNPSDRCFGYLEPNDETWAKSLDSLSEHGTWNDYSPLVDRELAPGENGAMPRFKIRTLADARRVRLKLLDQSALVLAQIEVEGNNSKKDKRYGIKVKGGKPQTFFLIADSKYENKNDSYNLGRAITTWAVVGLRYPLVGSASLEWTRKHGTLRYCSKKHSTQPAGANFVPCPAAAVADTISMRIYGAAGASADRLIRAMQVELSSRPRGALTVLAVTAALTKVAAGASPALTEAEKSKFAAALVKILDEQPGDPAWMACGGGCCTADDK